MSEEEFAELRLTKMTVRAWKAQMAVSFAAKFPKEAAQILEAIRHGIDVDFKGERLMSRPCHNPPLARPEFEPKVTAIIDEDVADGKKAGPFEAQPFRHFITSPIGAVPKRDSDKVRVIHNLSYPRLGDSVNSATEEGPCKLGSFDEACAFIRTLGAGALLVKLDVKAAYKQVPVRPQDWPLLGFRWRLKWYFERVLPFGLKSSCRLWELFATALHHFINVDLGIECVVHYVDDFLFAFPASDGDLAKHMMDSAIEMAARLGIPFADEKAEGPTTKLTFLGIELDTVAMEARLSGSRLQEFTEMLAGWESAGAAGRTVDDLASLIGKLDWACRVIRVGRPFKRRLLEALKWHRKRHAAGTAKLTLSEQAQGDIAWWRALAKDWNGVGLLYEIEWSNAERKGAVWYVHTDACNTGYGAVHNGRWFRGEWTPAQLRAAQRSTRTSMPFLELHALVQAAVTWSKHWRGKRIVFYCDAEAAYMALKKRASRTDEMAELIRILTLDAVHNGYDFKCAHIAGVKNVTADALSRGGDVLSNFRAQDPAALLLSPFSTQPTELVLEYPMAQEPRA